MRVCGARIHYCDMLGSMGFVVELEILRGSFLRRGPRQAQICLYLRLLLLHNKGESKGGGWIFREASDRRLLRPHNWACMSNADHLVIFGMENLTSKKTPAIFPKESIEKEFIIDNSAKTDIRNSLNSLSINENTLFPELEHQANYLIK